MCMLKNTSVWPSIVFVMAVLKSHEKLKPEKC